MSHLRVFTDEPSYEEWCEANGLDPDDDENFEAFCEWRNNQ